jgi:hypothetical protein
MNYEKRGLLKMAINSHYQYQELRKSLSNRLAIKKDGETQDVPERTVPEADFAMFKALIDNAAEREKETLKYIESMVKDEEVYIGYLEPFPGVGPAMAGVLLSQYDFEIATTPSKMWAFSGLAPGRDKLVKGEKSPFNKWLRTKLIGVIGMQLMIHNDFYKTMYVNERVRIIQKYCLENEEDPSSHYTIGEAGEVSWAAKKTPIKGKSHGMARRKMVKFFVRNLWIVGRVAAGFPTRVTYAEEYLGIKHDGAEMDPWALAYVEAKTIENAS